MSTACAKVFALALMTMLLLVVAACPEPDPEPTTTEPSAPATSPEPPPTTAMTERPATTEGAALQNERSWAELTDIEFPGDAKGLGISDRAVIFQTGGAESASVIYAHLFDEGRMMEIPSPTGTPADFAIEDDLVVWYEAYFSGDSFVNNGMYSMQLPDGPVVELIGPGREVAYPRLTDAAVAWTEPRETNRAGGMVVEQPIHYMELTADGSPAGEPRLLVPRPLRFIGGGALWDFDVSERYVAWELDVAGQNAGVGLYAMDLDSGGETFIGPDGSQPSLSGAMLAFSGGIGTQSHPGSDLTLRNLDTGDEHVLDPLGYLPSLQSWFVAYIVGPENGVWQVAVSGLDGQDRQFLGEHPMPVEGSTLVTSEQHVAFLDPDGIPRIFEWRGAERD